MENGLWEFVETIIPIPIDVTQLVEHKKKDVKAKRIILDTVNDHLIPHIATKTSGKMMCDALTILYQTNN